MHYSDKIYIAGHRGLAGSAIVRCLQNAGYTNLVYRSHAELDLTEQQKVHDFFRHEKPDYVFVAAAKVGGIHANNTYRSDFIYQNLAIAMNVIDAARRHDTQRLMFLASGCIYPRMCSQPMQESDLLSGYLEPTNEPYAIAKIAGIKLCEAANAQYGTDFTSVIPANLYGPNDNYDLQNSHVLPALIRRIHEAKVKSLPDIAIWGTGNAKREFLHVDDMASACLFIMNRPGLNTLLNIGSNEEVTIRELVESVCAVVGFNGNIIYDTQKPDGAPRKLLDSSQLATLGWKPTIKLQEGLRHTYEWFLTHYASVNA